MKQEWEPKRYLIQQRWWTQWCVYVNFDTKQHLDNSYDLNLLPKPAPPLSQESEDSDVSAVYEKPPRINNSGLLQTQKRGAKLVLRDNLCEHFDFEVIYPVVWKHFYSWYSSDVQIVRQLKKDALNRHVMILDLYPEEGATPLSDEEPLRPSYAPYARSVTPLY